tara:strand:- start:253 stop:738 length:486 start_codon:yes stop_codon:yes gene_type:complete
LDKEMKKYLLTIAALLAISLCFAQDGQFQIEKKGIFKKTIIKSCGFELSHQQFIEFISNDPLMDNYTKPLAGIFITNSLLNATGTVLSTWPLWQLQFDKEPNLNLTYVGVGIVVTSIVLNKIFINKAVKAARYYNNGYQEPQKVGLQLQPASSGVGIALVF